MDLSFNMEIISQIFFYLEYLFWFVLVFSIIVFIHEFGHYYIAKLNKVKVEKFSIGFGSPILKFRDASDTIWQVCLIPLGGYVKFAGEMYPDQSKKHDEKINDKLFMNKTSLQKASIVLAGPLANFILGIVLFFFIFILFGKNYTSSVVGSISKDGPSYKAGLLEYDKILSINKVQVKSFEDISNLLDEKIYDALYFEIERNNQRINLKVIPEKKIIDTFIGSKREINYLGFEPVLEPTIKKAFKGKPAFDSGIIKNDKIIKIDDKIVQDIKDVISIVEANPKTDLNFTILREDKQINFIITPELVYTADGKEKGVIGVQFSRERKRLNILSASTEALNNFKVIIVKTLIAFSEIIFGKRDHCEVGGPILIAKVSNDIGSQDLVSFMSLIALISINLGLINLFPLPLLDGGHFFTYMYEGLNNKKVTKNFYKYFQTVGAFIIISLMFFSVFNDFYCRVLN